MQNCVGNFHSHQFSCIILHSNCLDYQYDSKMQTCIGHKNEKQMAIFYLILVKFGLIESGIMGDSRIGLKFDVVCSSTKHSQPKSSKMGIFLSKCKLALDNKNEQQMAIFYPILVKFGFIERGIIGDSRIGLKFHKTLPT